MSKLNLTKVGRVAVSVSDTDRALDFYVGTLGFEKVVDVPMGDAGRWVEVAIPGRLQGHVVGADVDAEIARYGGPVPPMFWVRDPDGNSLIVVEPTE